MNVIISSLCVVNYFFYFPNIQFIDLFSLIIIHKYLNIMIIIVVFIIQIKSMIYKNNIQPLDKIMELFSKNKLITYWILNVYFFFLNNSNKKLEK